MTSRSTSLQLVGLVLVMAVLGILLPVLAPSSASAALPPCDGGGRIVNFGALSLSDCTISGNSTAGSGGGVENHGTLDLTNVVISQNHADADGGGIYNEGTLTLINVVVAENTAGGFGGGIENDGGTVYMSNVTVTGNLAGAGGGGITNLGSMIGAGIAVANNTTSTGEGGGILNMAGSFCLSAGTDFDICSGPNASPSQGDSLVSGNHASAGGGAGGSRTGAAPSR